MGKSYIVGFNPEHYAPVLSPLERGQKLEAWKTQESEKWKKLSLGQQIALALKMLNWLKESWYFSEDQSWKNKFKKEIASLEKLLPHDDDHIKSPSSREDSIPTAFKERIVGFIPEFFKRVGSQDDMASTLEEANNIIESAYLASRTREEIAAKVKAEILLSPERENEYKAKLEHYIKKNEKLEDYQAKISAIEDQYNLKRGIPEADTQSEALEPLPGGLFSYMQAKSMYSNIILDIDNRRLSFPKVKKLAGKAPTAEKAEKDLERAESLLGKNSALLLDQIETLRKHVHGYMRSDDMRSAVELVCGVPEKDKDKDSDKSHDSNGPRRRNAYFSRLFASNKSKNYDDLLSAIEKCSRAAKADHSKRQKGLSESLDCMVQAQLLEPLASTYDRAGWSVMREIEARQKLDDLARPTDSFKRLPEKGQQLVELLLAIYAAKSAVGTKELTSDQATCLQRKIEAISIAKARWSAGISSSPPWSTLFFKTSRLQWEKELKFKENLDIELSKVAQSACNLKDVNNVTALREEIKVGYDDIAKLEAIEDSISPGKEEESHLAIAMRGAVK